MTLSRTVPSVIAASDRDRLLFALSVAPLAFDAVAGIVGLSPKIGSNRDRSAATAPAGGICASQGHRPALKSKPADSCEPAGPGIDFDQ
jgi:hypothetical protein